MAFKQVNAREPISGFWTRNGAFEGTFVKFKEGKSNADSYFLFRVTQATPVVTKEGDGNQITTTAKPGEIVAIAHCSALECIETCSPGEKVRIESNGKKPTKDGKNQFWDFAVFLDDGEDDVPIR